MARIRTLKPEIWMSPQVMNLSHSARLLFIGLITQADDHGRGTADPRRLKAAVFGGDDSVSSADVRQWLEDVSKHGLVVLYEAPAHGLLYSLPTWRRHQKIDRPGPSNYPAAEAPLELQASAGAGASDSTKGRRALDDKPSNEQRLLDGDRKDRKDRKDPGIESEGGDAGEVPRAQRSAEERGLRLPQTFQITPEMREWARVEASRVDIDAETRAFCEYWWALPGNKARKLDWTMTWRNRMRDLEARAKQQPEKIGDYLKRIERECADESIPF